MYLFLIHWDYDWEVAVTIAVRALSRESAKRILWASLHQKDHSGYMCYSAFEKVPYQKVVDKLVDGATVIPHVQSSEQEIWYL